MVLSRSRPLLARYDVSPHMVKWWKSQKPDNGQVTRHLSPYEQQAIMPWLRSFPKKTYDKFMGSFMYWGSSAVIVLGTASLSDAADAAQDREHRF
mmetsp:Transcript_2693/g.7053  ORF Transcript_2693/g.7053 Transcript_2693/m.7053 type:complete len:95 (-) Transcript_2693:387-671(-)|eukprot:CAMPEP_0113569300 /NCGR_PEP_ID=MMETSP0015_2-20120614/24342_1 /TAXON_ID=2838 /ORGANISM="Odontella" /LENGTH=94 /DNA_ID=CAMNT_0000471965 /DNA_START=63 /DNA_END=347 /DNA_ORIENTATION=+ /assembly_acc=CAM_ASM_000160